MIRLVYLLGEPGAGKTTLVNRVLADHHRRQVDIPVPHELLTAGDRCASVMVGTHLGRARGMFGGTDALAFNIQPAVLAWLATTQLPLVLAEGDRLANARFFDAVLAQGHDLQVVLLATSPQLAAARRATRAHRQDPRWVAGRITKTYRLADVYATWTIGGQSAPRMLRRILGWPPDIGTGEAAA